MATVFKAEETFLDVAAGCAQAVEQGGAVCRPVAAAGSSGAYFAPDSSDDEDGADDVDLTAAGRPHRFEYPDLAQLSLHVEVDALLVRLP